MVLSQYGTAGGTRPRRATRGLNVRAIDAELPFSIIIMGIMNKSGEHEARRVMMMG
jgi:hypothetical protein